MTSVMYTKFAEEYDRAIRDNFYNAQFERPSLMSLLPPLYGMKVLDLGCGPGVYAEDLIRQGAEVTAIDNSTEMIEIAKNKIGDKNRCYVQDISIGLPQEESDSFDIVICPLAIHYLACLDVLFKDIRRVLKRGGVFIFSTNHPNIDYRSSPSGNYFATEQITEEWHTIGRPVAVSYYRRPISALANSISKAGMVIANISEGKPTEDLKRADPELFKKLSTKPNFMFYMCKPAN